MICLSKVTVAVGAQGGDEGKGKIIDYISNSYDLIVRFQGGDNAGHTVVNDKGVFHMRLIPSGVFNSNATCLIGTGTVVNPETLIAEINYLNERGVNTNNIFVSSKAHILFPHHIQIDVENEKKQGVIDTTKRGIGPAYADRALRENLRFENLYESEAIERYVLNSIPRINSILDFYNIPQIDVQEFHKKIEKWKYFFKGRLVEPVSYVHNYISKGKSVLFEGQLGLQRDLDLGQYPYVTSSYPAAAYACVSAGIPVFSVTNVLGIARAYPILAGHGPFPTEMDEEKAQILRGTGQNIDDEYGINTRRPRRIGWPDIPLLKYTNQINGYTELALCKLDKFDQFDKIQVCTSYSLSGNILDYYPSTAEMWKVTPQYIILDGWQSSTRNIRKKFDLPYNARKFIEIIENSINVEIKYVGVGPHRDDVAL